ncbi:MAG: hypothetical protein IJ105_01620 [Bacilli bacterium]|nr:hypothetical protein [Bacilli bacterium]
MNILNNLGISYKANYLIQGNQIERCNTSSKLNVLNTELMLRTDGKDSNIDNILKNYNGNIVFHLPAINPDLSNLDVVNNVVKDLKKHNIKLVTIDASNLSLDLFEWSTIEEQKNYFLNMVTAIATLASNKVEVAVQNLKTNDPESKFGSTMSQITDLLVYSKRLLTKDFGFKEEEADNYVGISLNVDNINLIDEKESIINYLEVFDNYIKCIKIHDNKHLDEVLDFIKDKDIPLFMQTKSDLDEIEKEYNMFQDKIINYMSKNGLEVTNVKKVLKQDNKGFSNIIIYTMIVLTLIIVVLMFLVKLR